MPEFLNYIPTIPAVIVAALITISGTFLIQRLLTKRAHLVATISSSKICPPDVLNIIAWNHRLEIPEDLKSKLQSFDHVGGFTEIHLHNRGKKRIEGVSIIFECDGLYQVGERRPFEKRGAENTFVIPKDRKILLGDLHPNEKIVVYLWTSILPWYDFKSLKEKIGITAHEIDRLSFKVAVPSYLSSRYFLVRKAYIWTLFGS